MRRNAKLKRGAKPNSKPIPATSGLVAKLFKAMLERPASRLNWVLIRVPFNVAKVWGTRGQQRVKGEINGFSFRTSLFPTRQGGHIMIVNKKMQAGGGAVPGAFAQFRLQPDNAERIVTVPAELQRILGEDAALRRWFAKLNYSTRNYLSKSITQVKSRDARARRAEHIAEALLATMEGEMQLPPILQLAFAHEPRARAGWEQMSPGRRRGNLLSIFYYRGPDARARRVQKVVEEAVGISERKTIRENSPE